MAFLMALIFATTYLKFSVSAYLRDGCLETHVMSHIPTIQESLKHLNSSLKDLNESTIILNCDRPCHLSNDGVKSDYDTYEVFSFKLNKDQFNDLNRTFDKMDQMKEDDKYIITYDHDISHLKLRLWWHCFNRSGHGGMRHILNLVDKYQMNDMIGYKVTNPNNGTEVYKLVISDKTGTVLLIKPQFLVKGNVTYNNLLTFIFKRFELSAENYSDHIPCTL